jgi:hypothetical protein
LGDLRVELPMHKRPGRRMGDRKAEHPAPQLQ